MKTTHRKAVEAYLTLVKLSDVRRAPATQIKLFKLKKLLQPSFEFTGEEEKKLIEELGGVADDLGKVTFQKTEDLVQYNRERVKLLDLECEVDLEKKMTVHSEELKEISLAEMEALETFIDFV
jgi:hypothetical protein